LIEALADEWIRKYKDTFQENLKKLIETKLEGGEVARWKSRRNWLRGGFDGCSQAELGADGGRKKPAATAKSEAPAAAAGGSHGADGEVIEESRLGPPSKSWFRRGRIFCDHPTASCADASTNGRQFQSLNTADTGDQGRSRSFLVTNSLLTTGADLVQPLECLILLTYTMTSKFLQWCAMGCR